MTKANKSKKKVYSDRSARTAINIKRPGGTRKSFSLIKDIIDANGNRKFETIKDDRLKAINEAFKNDELDFNDASEKIEKLKLELLKQYVPSQAGSTNRSNKSLNNKLIEQTKTKNREKRKKHNFHSEDTLKIELNSLLRILGDLSLHTATKEDLLDVLDSAVKPSGEPYSISYLNRFVVRINQLLKIANRDFSLSKFNYEDDDYDVTYINEKQLRKLIEGLKEYPRKNKETVQYDIDLCIIAFYTGMRQGEILGFDKSSKTYNSRKHIYYVARQMERVREGSKKALYKAPKGGKKRWIPIPKEARQALSRWVNYDNEMHIENRRGSSKRIKLVCQELFDNPINHVSVHGLRHSYAHWLLSKGVGIDRVAMLLGDSIDVCKRHYIGTSLQDGAISEIQKLIS